MNLSLQFNTDRLGGDGTLVKVVVFSRTKVGVAVGVPVVAFSCMFVGWTLTVVVIIIVWFGVPPVTFEFDFAEEVWLCTLVISIVVSWVMISVDSNVRFVPPSVGSVEEGEVRFFTDSSWDTVRLTTFPPREEDDETVVVIVVFVVVFVVVVVVGSKPFSVLGSYIRK